MAQHVLKIIYFDEAAANGSRVASYFNGDA